MRLLVLGANGLLGSNVVDKALDREWTVVATYHSEKPAFNIPIHSLDIRDRIQFTDILEQVQPEAVVNCAAMTDVDLCEQDPDLAQAANGTAAKKLAAECSNRTIRFCHISTDYVFDGKENKPYSEGANPNPIQVYGKSKLAGDRAVQEAHSAPLLVRPSFIYGVHRSTESVTGFPAWVKSQLHSSGIVSLFRDQYITPSRAGQIASVLLQLLAKNISGIFNIACRTCTTPYEIGVFLRDRLRYNNAPIEAVSLDDIDRPADRPKHTCLDVSKVEKCLNIEQPTLESDLDTIEPVLRSN